MQSSSKKHKKGGESSLKIIRQGDVGLVPITDPAQIAALEANKDNLKDEKRRLIRRGEHGGMHQLETLEKATIFTLKEPVVLDGTIPVTRAIQVTEPTRVVHKEHNPVELEPGWYAVRIQREQFQQTVRFTGD